MKECFFFNSQYSGLVTDKPDFLCGIRVYLYKVKCPIGEFVQYIIYQEETEGALPLP